MLEPDSSVALESLDPEALYLRELDRIDRIVAFVARRNGLGEQLREGFRSELHLHLLEDDYAVLRAFDGRSELGTYLMVVVHRFLADFRDRRWGRWRPSAAARRAGPTAVLLETLVVRDGHEFAEAAELLRHNHHVEESRDELYELLCTFPLRHGKASQQRVDLEQAGTVAADGGGPDAALDQRRLGELEAVLLQVLGAEIADLSAEARLVLRMITVDGLSVSATARALHLDQKRLYRRLSRWREALRTALVRAGLDRDRVLELLDSRRGVQVFDAAGILDRDPSHLVAEDAGETEKDDDR